MLKNNLDFIYNLYKILKKMLFVLIKKKENLKWTQKSLWQHSNVSCIILFIIFFLKMRW